MGTLFSSGRRSLACLNSFAILAGAMVGSGVFLASERQALACGDTPYLGEICTFAFGYCPRGFAPADGSLVSVQQNSALFALLGTVYGGNGTQTFGLPDLRSRSVVGVGAGPNLPQSTVLGLQVGNQTTTLTSQQLPPHTHPASFVGTGGGSNPVSIAAKPGDLHVVATLKAKQTSGVVGVVNGSYLGQGGSGSSAAAIYVDGSSTAATADLGGLTVDLLGTASIPQLDFTVNSGITGGTVAVLPNTGGSQPISTQSPGLGLTQCIATNGIFPPRP